ncbi:flagellar biosynthetic protein FliO [Glycocaulis sp.]
MDAVNFFQYFAALLLVLGLLGGLALVLRRSGLAGVMPTFQRPGSPRRIEVTGSVLLDARRRVVTVRVDEEEHVILLGMSGETVLDRRPAPPRFEPVRPDEAIQDGTA